MLSSCASERREKETRERERAEAEAAANCERSQQRAARAKNDIRGYFPTSGANGAQLGEGAGISQGGTTSLVTSGSASGSVADRKRPAAPEVVELMSSDSEGAPPQPQRSVPAASDSDCRFEWWRNGTDAECQEIDRPEEERAIDVHGAQMTDDDDDVVCVGRRGEPLIHAREDCPAFPFGTPNFCAYCWCCACGVQAKECKKWAEHYLKRRKKKQRPGASEAAALPVQAVRH